MEVTATNIHRVLANGMPANQISHWYSDLYVKKTAFSAGIIANYKYKHFVTTFIGAIDNERWYEIPFAFDPEV